MLFRKGTLLHRPFIVRKYYAQGTTSGLLPKEAVSTLPKKRLYRALPFMAVFGTLFYFYSKDSRSSIHENVIIPFLHSFFDAEQSHNIAIWCAKNGLCPKEAREIKSPLIELELWNKKISNPIGLAAGFDKHAEGIDSLFEFGFGLVEIGSVTPAPQVSFFIQKIPDLNFSKPGNDKPRMFRLPQDNAVINRYGFNSKGMAEVANNLVERVRKFNYGVFTGPAAECVPLGVNKSLYDEKLLGINLGKNKLSPADSHMDYVAGVQNLGKYADYLVINVSSPNTPGLRSLQRREAMEELLTQVKKARDEFCPQVPPLLVKIAPDLSELEIADIAETILKVNIDGIIISNTTLSRPDTLKSDLSVKREYGGLSGPPVKPLAIKVVKQMYILTQGKIPILGCGGVNTAHDVLDYGKAGASLVQLYTSLGYKGPGIVTEMKHDLVELLKKEGKSWKEIVGSQAF